MIVISIKYDHDMSEAVIEYDLDRSGVVLQYDLDRSEIPSAKNPRLRGWIWRI